MVKRSEYKRRLRKDLADGAASGVTRQQVESAGVDPIQGKIFQPVRDERIAAQVEAMSAVGLLVADVAVALDIAVDDLESLYKRELESAPARANASVAKAFYDVARSGKDWRASQAWLQDRAGWGRVAAGSVGGQINIQINL